MFAKLSLMSFIYELTETFMFPSEKVRYIYSLFDIDYVCSTSLQFLFFSKDQSKVPGEIFRDLVFLVIVNTKIIKRFDLSDIF